MALGNMNLSYSALFVLILHANILAWFKRVGIDCFIYDKQYLL